MWEIKWDGTEQMKNLRQGGDYPSLYSFRLVRLTAHVSNGLKSRIRPVVGRI